MIIVIITWSDVRWLLAVAAAWALIMTAWARRTGNVRLRLACSLIVAGVGLTNAAVNFLTGNLWFGISSLLLGLLLLGLVMWRTVVPASKQEAGV